MVAQVQAQQSDGQGTSFDQAVELIAQQLQKLRDDVVAGTHPRLKIPPRMRVDKPSARETLPTKLPNGVQSKTAPAQPSPLATVTTSQPSQAHPIPQYPLSSVQKNSSSSSAAGSSGIDPLFLTKSDVLVRSEFNQKRQRLERGLETQAQQRKMAAKEKICDQEIVPDFDVGEVLKRAHELVPPSKSDKNKVADKTASSSDSFDENTFYSSQMNESTTTEEIDESRKKRPDRICNFFREHKPCKYGESCIYSHDPSFRQRLEGTGPQLAERERNHADPQPSSRGPDPLSEPASNGVAAQPAFNPPAPISQNELIAQLEEQLRALKETHQSRTDAVSSQKIRENQEPQEESAYSPPGPDEFGRNAELRAVHHESANGADNPASPERVAILREYPGRVEQTHPQSSQSMRIVQNHITSPQAPQPSRLSPLAVAKLPPVTQMQRNHADSRRTSRGSNVEVIHSGQSPIMDQQAPNARKRRRGRESGEHARNVVPRHEAASPGIRIKEELVSPPPFAQTRRVRQRQEPSRLTQLNTSTPQDRPQDLAIYEPRRVEREPRMYDLEERAPLTPITGRIVSRNGQRYIAPDEPELRRVVSARHVRAPLSPAPHPAQYSDPKPRSMRAASQVYGSASGQGEPPQYRASVQPQTPLYAPHDDPLSPPIRRIPAPSPIRHTSVAMAPPPRRIVVDQYGNRFIEAPLPPERQFSLAPSNHPFEMAARYEPNGPRSLNGRQTHRVDMDEAPSGRRAFSPASPRYVDYAPPSRPRQAVAQGDEIYNSEAYATNNIDPRTMDYEGPQSARRYEDASSNDARVIEHADSSPNGHYGEAIRSREDLVRTQSVRPVSSPFDMPREHMARVSSVRPQPPRIVHLSDRQDMSPQTARHVHDRLENTPAGGRAYAREERPFLQYEDPRYVEEIRDEGLYEMPSSSGGRRIVQRMM